MIKVYHFDHEKASRDKRWEVFSGKVVPTFNKLNYKLVAIAETDDLDRAYYLTNHIDKDWTTNYHVTAVNGKHRSTSVGDVLVKADGTRFYVAPVGFDKMEGEGGL